MISIDLIIITGIITVLLCLIVAWRYRGQTIPTVANMFVVRAGGAAAIALFYVGVKLGASNLLIVSRWIWLFILLSTAFMAINVLIMKRDKWHGRR